MAGTEKAEEAVGNVRPLNATQGRNLLQLVRGDFETLKIEMKEFAAEALAAKEKEIRDAADLSKQEEIQKKAKKLIRDFNEKRDKLRNEAKALGLDLRNIPGINEAVTVNDENLTQKLNIARMANKRELDSALNLLRKEQLAAERMVLKATITAQAEEILDSIPTAQEMMMKAAEARADHLQITK